MLVKGDRMKHFSFLALVVSCALALALPAKAQYTEKSHSLTGCLRADGGAPRTYQLTEVESGPKSIGLMMPRFDATPHIGHKVEVTGIDIPAKDAEWAANTPKHPAYMRIDALKMISTACPPPPTSQNQSDTPSTYNPDLKLQGHRFKALTWHDLDPAQEVMAEHMMMGERGGMNGPFNTALRSPEAGDLAERLGSQQRFHTSLPVKLDEFAILITAHYWGAQYEWSSHSRLAVTAGLNQTIIDALAADKRPSNMSPDEEVVYNFGDELLHTKHVSDANFNAMKEKFGDRGVVDLTGIMGYYSWVSLMLDIDP